MSETVHTVAPPDDAPADLPAPAPAPARVPRCPGCRGPRSIDTYTCRRCWYALPPETRLRLTRRDPLALTRLRELLALLEWARDDAADRGLDRPDLSRIEVSP